MEGVIETNVGIRLKIWQTMFLWWHCWHITSICAVSEGLPQLNWVYQCFTVAEDETSSSKAKEARGCTLSLIIHIKNRNKSQQSTFTTFSCCHKLYFKPYKTPWNKSKRYYGQLSGLWHTFYWKYALESCQGSQSKSLPS